MTCDPATLAAAARCFCFNERVADAVSIYLLCAWANAGADPAKQGFLLEDSPSYFLFDDGGKIMIQT